MNLLLIYPEFPDTFWSFKHALPFVGKRAVVPPAGRLLTIAALLPQGWSQRLVATIFARSANSACDNTAGPKERQRRKPMKTERGFVD